MITSDWILLLSVIPGSAIIICFTLTTALSISGLITDGPKADTSPRPVLDTRQIIQATGHISALVLIMGALIHTHFDPDTSLMRTLGCLAIGSLIGAATAVLWVSAKIRQGHLSLRDS